MSASLLLQDKRAVVFGGGGSIGAAVAKEFASEGAEVFPAGRTAENVEAAAKQITASLLVIQGVIGVRLKRRADDYASATVGADALRRGLEKLAAANATKRRAGRAWNLLTQHPGLDQRIERLRQTAAHPQPVR
jgi:NAD(P)-dependent dehydrogenase (short-subunit alcohol dehydrogenase family)